MKELRNGKEIVFDGEVCPLCGGRLYAYNYPEDDMTDGIYCEHDDDNDCPYFRNQFMSYEDMQSIEASVKETLNVLTVDSYLSAINNAYSEEEIDEIVANAGVTVSADEYLSIFEYAMDKKASYKK